MIVEQLPCQEAVQTAAAGLHARRLGFLPAAAYAAVDLVLTPATARALHHGIVEAVDPDCSEYGLTPGRGLPPPPAGARALAHTLERDLAVFVQNVPFADDRTLVLVQRLEG